MFKQFRKPNKSLVYFKTLSYVSLNKSCSYIYLIKIFFRNSKFQLKTDPAPLTNIQWLRSSLRALKMRTLAPQETTFWGLNQARSLAADEMQTYCRVSAQSGDNQPSQPCIPAEQAQGARGPNLHLLQHQLPCQDLLQCEHFPQPPPDWLTDLHANIKWAVKI